MPHQKTTSLPVNAVLPQFAQWLGKQGLSHKTVVNYVSDTRKYASWLDSVKPSVTVKELSPEITQEFLVNEQHEGISASTLERRLASLRKLEEFLAHELNVHVALTLDRNPFTPTDIEAAKTRILHRFALALAAQDCKESTIQNYVLDVELFAKTALDLPFAQLCTKPKLAEYQAELKQQGLAQTSIERKLVSLKRFCAWASSEGIIPTNPFQTSVREILTGHNAATPLAFFEARTQRINSEPKTERSTRSLGKLGSLLPLYHWYSQSRISSYLHLSILILFTVLIALFGYQQFFRDVQQPLAYPSEAVRPGRRLSFQGRLTDTSGTPITTAINVQFRLYNVETGGTALWDSTACSIDPDQDGIFASVLGDPVDGCGAEIPNEVFSENSDIWLEVQVASETLTPRQRIAAVGYALNSETLQGFPPSLSGDINTIPVISALGQLIIGAENPSLIASSGAFLIQGESLTFQTEVGSAGDITFAPDAGGTVIINSGTSSQDSLYIANANLTDGNLIHGYVGNDTSTGNLLVLSSGSVEQEMFSVSTGGDVNIFGDTTIGASLNVDSGTLFVDEINNRVGISTLTPDRKLEVLDGTGNPQLRLTNVENTQFAELGVNSSGSLSLTTTGSTGNISLDAVSNIFFSDARVTNVPLSVNDTQLNPALGTGIIDAINATYTVAATNVGHWDIASGTLQPRNTTVDLLIGGTSTASAKFAFLNVSQGTPTASFSGNLVLSGTGRTIGTTEKNQLTLGSAETGGIAIAPSGNVAVYVQDVSGNVGIGTGTTAPNARFQVKSSAVNSDVASFTAFDGSRLARLTETAGGHGWFEIDDNTGTAKLLVRADGGDSYFNSGEFGFGTTSPDRKLEILDASGNSQLRLTHTDGSIFTDLETNSAGNLLIGPSGGSSIFSGDVDVETTLYVGTTNAFQVVANGDVTTQGDLALNGGDLTSSGNMRITPTGTLTLNSTGNATIDSSADIALDADGGNVTLFDGGSSYADFASSGQDLVLSSTGFDVMLPSRLTVGSTTPGKGYLNVSGSIGNALTILDETGSAIDNNDILAASASGTTVARLTRGGDLLIEGSIADLSGSVLTVNDSLRVQGNSIQDAGGAAAITFDGSQNVALAGTLTLPNSSTLIGDSSYLRSTRGIAFGANQTYFVDASGHANFNNLTAAGTLDINGAGTHDIAGTLNLSGGTLTRAAGTLSITTTTSGNIALTSAGEIIFDDTRTDAIPFSLTDANLNLFPAGERAIVDALNYLFVNGGGGSGGGSGAFWSNTAEGAYLTDTRQSLLIGGNSSASAKFRVNGETGDIIGKGDLNVTKYATVGASLTVQRDANVARDISAGGSITAPLATFSANFPTSTPLSIVGTSGQTGNLTNWKNSAGTTLAYVDASGVMNLPNNGLVVGTTQLVASGGKVGVGTASPNEMLDVIGNLLIQDNETATKAFRVQTSSNTALQGAGSNTTLSVFANADFTGTEYSYLSLSSSSQLAQAVGAWNFVPSVGGTVHHIIDGGAGGDVVFNDDQLAGADFTVKGDTVASLFFVDSTNDRVGIGTASPAERFHLVDGSGGAQVVMGDTGFGSTNGGIGFNSTLNGTNYALSGNGSGTTYLNANGSGVINFAIDNSTQMQLTNGGLLRLGSTAPTLARLNLTSGATAADGIAFGLDTNLYRNAANSLKTDDQFVAYGGMTIGKDTLATNFEFDLDGDAQLSGQFRLGNVDLTTNPTGLGTGALLYGTNDNRMYYFDGTQWISLAAGSEGSLWYMNNIEGDPDGGVIHAKNINPDFIVGGYSTASAKFRVDATDGHIHAIGNATIDGTATFGGPIRIGNSLTDPTTLGAGSLYYNSTENKVYYHNGVSWVAFGDASDGSLWYMNPVEGDPTGGIIRPKNINSDLVIGGYSTASAKFWASAKDGSIKAAGYATVSADLTTRNIILSSGINSGSPSPLAEYGHKISDANGNLTIDSTGLRVIIHPDLQITGGDILGINAETRISINDALDSTTINGLLDVKGTQKLFDTALDRGTLYSHLNAVDKIWTTSRDFNQGAPTESSTGLLHPSTNDELKLATTDNLTSKTWTSTADFNEGGTTFTSGVLNPAGNNELQLTSTFSSPAGLAGWIYRSAISVTAATSLTNHQVSITLNTSALISAGKMKSDCSDLRMTDSTGTATIAHVIEKGCNTTTTLIWIKAASLSTSPTTFYAYYGNPAATDTQNGESVFDFYDDFSQGSINTTSKWVLTNSTGFSVSTNGELVLTNATGRLTSIAGFSDNVVQEVRYKPTTTPSIGVMTAGFFLSTTNHFGHLENTSLDYTTNNSTSFVSLGSHKVVNGGDYLIQVTTPDASNVKLDIKNYSDNTSLFSTSNFANAITNEPIVLGQPYNNAAGTVGNVAWDWVRVRKYAASTPVATVGSETSGSYTTGEQSWTSNYVDAGAGNVFKPTTFTASWALDGGNNIAPKFQLIGSNNSSFTGATVYPGASDYYVNGGTGSNITLNSGEEKNVSAQVVSTFRYWKVKAYFETGAGTLDTPKIYDISISGQGQYSGGEQIWQSETIHTGETGFLPNILTANWALNGSDNEVRFQVVGSSDDNFTESSTTTITFPDPQDEDAWYCDGCAYEIENGVPLNIWTQTAGVNLVDAGFVTGNIPHWKVRVMITTGVETGDTPKVFDVRLQNEKPLILNEYGQKVGVNTASPDAQLHVMSKGSADAFKVSTMSGTTILDFFKVRANGDSDFGDKNLNDVNLNLYGDLLQTGDTTLRTGLTNVRGSFLYDTGRDDDGGAWRKSAVTRSLSWYVEGRDDGIGDPCNLTQDDRCGRKDFPAKAQLLITDDSLYIFDVSNNQMWMRFKQDNGFALGANANNDPSSVTAQDGVVYVSTNGSDSSNTGIYAFDFKTDTMAYIDTTDRSESNEKISQRNSANSYNTNNNTAFALTNNKVNDLDSTYYQGKRYLAAATDSGINLINLDYITNYEFIQVSGPDDGTASDDGNDGNVAANAFDFSFTTYAGSNAADNTLILTNQLNTAKVIRRYGVISTAATLGEAPAAWTFEGSNDGTTWTVLDTQSGVTNWVSITTSSDQKFYEINNSTAFTRYRLNITDASAVAASKVRVAEFYLQERRPVPAVRVYNTNALQPKVTVSSSSAVNREYWLTDRRRDTTWISGTNGRYGWIQFHYPEPIVAYNYSITAAGTAANFPTGWIFMGSNDGVNWTNLESPAKTGQSLVANIRTTYTISNTTAYKFYRFKINSVASSTTLAEIGEFDINGPSITASGSNNNTTNDETNLYFQDQLTTALASYWQTSAGQQNNGNVTYDYGVGNEKIISTYSLRGWGTGATAALRSWRIQGSNDCSSFTDLDTRSQVSGTPFTTSSTRINYSFSNTTAYRCYRLQIDANNGTTVTQVREWNMGLPSVEASSENDPTTYTATDATLWNNVKTAVGWISASGDRTGDIIMDFGYERRPVITGVVLTGANTVARSIRDFTIRASNDRSLPASSWTSFLVRNNVAPTTTTERRAYTFPNLNGYRYWMLDIDANNGDASFVSLSEIELMGSTYNNVRFSAGSIVGTNETTGELDIYNFVFSDTTPQSNPGTTLNTDPQNDTLATRQPSLSYNVTSTRYALEADEGVIHYGSANGVDTLHNLPMESNTATARNIRKVSTYSTESLLANRFSLRNYWPFNEGTQQSSISDYGTAGADSYFTYNTTNHAEPQKTADGKIGGAYTFDRASTQHFVIADADIGEIDTGNGQYTVGAWIKPTTTTTTGLRQILGTAQNFSCDSSGDTVANTCTSGWYLGLANDTANRVSWFGCAETEGSGCAVGFSSDAGDISLGNWNHVVIRRDSSGTALFVNGTKVYTTSTGISVTDGGDLYLGVGGLAYNSSTNHFDGSIDETFIAARGLTDEEVRSMYRIGADAQEIPAAQADIFTDSSIGSSSANLDLNQFRGRIVEIVEGTGAGQSRLVTKNNSTTLEVAPSWSTTPGSSSVYRVLPYNLPGNINKTQAIRIDQDSVYVGLNDTADTGGVVRIRRSDETVTDYYHSGAGKVDDHGNVWSGASGYDNIVGIETTQDNLMIAAENQVWREKIGDSLLESIDKLQQAMGSALLDSYTQRNGGTNELNQGQQVIRKGWGYISGAETSRLVYYGTTFKEAPIVMLTQAGILENSPPSSLEDCSFSNNDETVINMSTINKDSFKVQEFGASTAYYYCYTWIAIGQSTGTLPDGTFSGGADLAEWYGTDNESLKAAEVVSVAKSGDIKVDRTSQPQDPKAIGIIATQPSITLGPKSGLTPGYNTDPQLANGAKTAVQVALAGRVPLKVSLENGPIEPGDYLTPSSIPGVAAKAIKAGPTIGKALERFDGKSTLEAVAKTDATLEPALQSLASQAEQTEGVVSLSPETTVGEDGSIATSSASVAQDLLSHENFTELDQGIGTIMTFVNTSYFDPNYASASASLNSSGGSFAIDSSGKLVALGTYSFDLVDQVRNAVFNPLALDDFGGVASSSAVATGSAVIADREGTLNSALARLQTLGSLALKEMNVAKLRVLDTFFARNIETDSLQAGVTKTDLLAPLSQADVVVQLGGDEASPSGQFIVLDKNGDQLAAIDSSGTLNVASAVAQEMEARFLTAQDLLTVNGDAAISGNLTAESARFQALQSNQAELASLQTQDATISGTLYANNIAGLEQRVRELISKERAQEVPASASALIADSSTDDLIDSMLGQETTTTDEYGNVTTTPVAPLDLENIDGDIQLSGTLLATNIVAQDILTVGRATLNSNSLATTFAPDCSDLLSSCGVFSIQPSGTGTLDLLASTVIISKTGGVEINTNVTIAGDTTVKGSLFASMLQPISGQNLGIDLASAPEGQTPNPSELVIRGVDNKEVAAFSASGSARFQKVVIAAEEAKASESIETSVVTNSTTGTGKLAAGTKQFTIRNSQLQSNSLVYLTPTSGTQNRVIYVASRQVDNPETPDNEGQFVVAIDDAIDTDITFNWWIIN